MASSPGEKMEGTSQFIPMGMAESPGDPISKAIDPIPFMDVESNSKPPKVSTHPPLSYKNTLLGHSDMETDSNNTKETLEAWLAEEENVTPEYMAELEKLKKIYPEVGVTNDEWISYVSPWKDALVISLLGRRLTYRVMKDRLCRLWGLTDLELTEVENNYYLVKLRNNQEYDKVLTGGPWVIQGHYLVIQRWTPNFCPAANTLSNVAVWVHIPSLPPYYCNERYLRKLGNVIGRTIKVDPNTLAQVSNRVDRACYARISVEIDLRKKLISKVITRKAVFPMEYEGLNIICFGCGRYGHRKEECTQCSPPSNTNESTQNTGTNSFTPQKMPSFVTAERHRNIPVDEEYGPWMVVKRNLRTRQQRPVTTPLEEKTTDRQAAPQKSQTKPSSSRFAVLSDLMGSDDRTEAQQNYTEVGKEEALTEKGAKDTSVKGKEKVPDWSFNPNVNAAHFNFEAKKPKTKSNNIRKPKQNGEKPSSQVSGLKRETSSKPKILSPIQRKKATTRIHRVVLGSPTKSGPLDFGPETKHVQPEEISASPSPPPIPPSDATTNLDSLVSSLHPNWPPDPNNHIREAQHIPPVRMDEEARLMMPQDEEFNSCDEAAQ